ncbi:MAG: exonuclease SbcCD subunit D [Lachnospiraceae bacterium]|nr:exonuclease SbcCD subunit D [Lachnospiraceae bacterium]
MKFIHISDLHLGKRVYEFPMLEEQRDILEKILGIAKDERADGVLVAGDVYDRQVPSAEAVQLFDWFLTALAEMGLYVFVISGNHDSAERLAFGARLMETQRVYLAPVFAGEVKTVSLTDAYGELCIYLLPFIKPAYVRRFYPDREIADYEEALGTVMEHMSVDETKRNILLAHQFVTGASRSESEEITAGGLDNVSAEHFAAFDYTALGHIHRPQSVGAATIRYCGTPLKYSFSEAGHEKSVTVVELMEKGRTDIRTIPLKPLRDLREIRGSYEEITARKYWENTETEDYLHVTLTDEEDIPEAIRKLRVIYPNIMKLDYDNRRTRSFASIEMSEKPEEKTPLQLFEELYRLQNNQDLGEEQRAYLTRLVEEIWEVER